MSNIIKVIIVVVLIFLTFYVIASKPKASGHKTETINPCAQITQQNKVAGSCAYNKDTGSISIN